MGDTGLHRTTGLHQSLVEHGVLAATQYLGGRVQRRLVFVGHVAGGNQQCQGRQVDIVLQGHIAVAIQ